MHRIAPFKKAFIQSTAPWYSKIEPGEILHTFDSSSQLGTLYSAVNVHLEAPLRGKNASKKRYDIEN